MYGVEYAINWPSQHPISGHCRPASETPPDSGPILRAYWGFACAGIQWSSVQRWAKNRIGLVSRKPVFGVCGKIMVKPVHSHAETIWKIYWTKVKTLHLNCLPSTRDVRNELLISTWRLQRLSSDKACHFPKWDVRFRTWDTRHIQQLHIDQPYRHPCSLVRIL